MATGYKIANDVLTEMAFHLVEPIVNTTVTSIFVEGYGDGGYGDGGYGDSPDGPGSYVVYVPSIAAMYVGAMILVGAHTANQEVVTIVAVGDNYFNAVFTKVHVVGETVTGATFPVGELPDPFYTQREMLNYVANAQNDYLLRVPLIYNVVTQAFASGQQTQSMPADSIQMERVAGAGYALYEQGQSSLDLLNYSWGQQGAGMPTLWYEDRTGFMIYGLDRIPLNQFSLEVLYAQRGPATLELGGVFLLPDAFLTYVKYGALAAVFSKDGEQRDPERAQYCAQRFETGVKIGQQFYKNAMAQEVVNG